MRTAPVPTTRQERKRATRERLILAAYKRFSRHGIAATRVTDVAAAAAVSHGTAFLHFATRDALVAAVVGHYASQIAVRLHELAAEGAGVREVLLAHLQGLREHEQFYMRLVTETPLLGRAARSTLVGIQSAIAAQLAAACERERKLRKLRPVPPSFVFNLWIGLIHHYLVNRDLFAPRGSVLDRRGPELVDQFMHLIATHAQEATR